MNFALDLLEQADHLSRREQKRPRQASLRRATSTAYYALFHLLSSEVGAYLAPAGTLSGRARLQRTLGHKEMKLVCSRFLQSPRTQPLLSLLPAEPSQALRNVALAFVQLQEARHSADYDMFTTWTREKAVGYVRLAREAFAQWNEVGRAEAEIFLLALFNLKQLDLVAM